MTQRLENTTKTPIGQGSGGPDKSKATPVLYTQMGTASSLANDGILAGREVETNAEILERWGDTLTTKDRLAFGWVEPGTIYDDLPEGAACVPHGLADCVECSIAELRDALGMCAEHTRRDCHKCRKSAQPTTFRPTDPGKINSRTESRRYLGEIEYERCPQYAVFRRTDYDGDTTPKGRGCGAKGCPACRHNRDLRDHGKPYANGVGDLITDIVVTGDSTMNLGKGSPCANLRNAHREICSLGAFAMLGPGFRQRIIIDGVMDDLGKHVEYLRQQPGVTGVAVTIGEPPTFAELYAWMGEREEWHHGLRRWRFHKWGVEKPPNLKAPYSDDIENANEEEEDMGDTPAVAALKAYVMAAPLGPERDAAVKVAELTIVQGYIRRRVSLPKVWIRALTDALGRRTCIDGVCRCEIKTDAGRKRHVAAAERVWVPAMYAVAAYVGESRCKEHGEHGDEVNDQCHCHQCRHHAATAHGYAVSAGRRGPATKRGFAATVGWLSALPVGLSNQTDC